MHVLLRRAVLCCATGPAHGGLYRGWVPAAPFIITLNTPAGLRGRDRLRCVVSENILQPAMELAGAGPGSLAAPPAAPRPPCLLAYNSPGHHIPTWFTWEPLSSSVRMPAGAVGTRARLGGRALPLRHCSFIWLVWLLPYALCDCGLVLAATILGTATWRVTARLGNPKWRC